MIALKHLSKGFLLICSAIGLVESKKEYPRIQDVVSFSSQRVDLYYIPSVVKEIRSSIDVDKISRFKGNEAFIRSLIQSNLDDSVLRVNNREVRRQMVTLKKVEKDNDYDTAIKYQFRTKISDCMLQLVYMSRHFLKIFEKSEFLDKTTPSYRMGYIGRKLKYFYKKAIRLLEILNVRQQKSKWTGYTTSAPLNLHHRVARLSIDFNYYYELMKRLHQIYRPGETPSGIISKASSEDDAGGGDETPPNATPPASAEMNYT